MANSKYVTSIWVECPDIIKLLDKTGCLEQDVFNLAKFVPNTEGRVFSCNPFTNEFFRHHVKMDEIAKVESFANDKVKLYTDNSHPVEMIQKLSKEYPDDEFVIAMQRENFFEELPVEMHIKNGKIFDEYININWPGLHQVEETKEFLNDTDFYDDDYDEEDYYDDDYWDDDDIWY